MSISKGGLSRARVAMSSGCLARGGDKVNRQPVTARASPPSCIHLFPPPRSSVPYPAVMYMLFSQEVHTNHYMCAPKTAELFDQVVVIPVTRAGI
jgi:hypothetical protein